MNILVTGNGFDLSLGLKTKYEDYLKFARYFSLSWIGSEKEIIPSKLQYNIESNMKKIFANNANIRDMYLLSEGIDDFLQTLNVIKGSPQQSTIITDFYSCIRSNGWFVYFWELFENNRILGKNWIDLEEEIKNVIEKITEISGNSDENGTLSYYINDKIMKSSSDLCISHELASRLKDDFQRFVLAFDIYLSIFVDAPEWVKTFNASKVLIIKEQLPKIDNVMTFNYMNNYDVLFSQSRPMDNICYVHGQLHYKKHLNEVYGQNDSYIEKYKNNLPLVLGFYVNEVKGYDFLEYQKFFQRTHNGVSSKYISWFGTEENINVFIVGHSLATSDKEVLEKIFMHCKSDRMHIDIFYHNDETHERLEKKLVEIIGVGTFIFCTRIKNNIRFLKQNW